MVNRGRLQPGAAGPPVAAETTQKLWRRRESGLTGDNPLVFLETAKEKVWKSLEKFGNPWNFLGKAWKFLGKVWKSLENLEGAAMGRSIP
jgi:hypothetical protein